MKTINFILVNIALICSITSCKAEKKYQVIDKKYEVFLNRFKTVNLPYNYKKNAQLISSMTKEEAMFFLQKKEEELYLIESEYEEETDEISYYKQENIPGCDYKYKLNDSIYIICTREGGQGDSAIVYLNSFSLQGKRIDKCIVGEQFTMESDRVSHVVLSKNRFRVFYYYSDNSREEEGFITAVYYLNYEILENGKFVKKDKSDITWLKNYVIYYSTYEPNSDDPINAY